MERHAMEALDNLIHPGGPPDGPPPDGSPPASPPGSPPGPSERPPYQIIVNPPPPNQKVEVAKPDKFSGDKRHLLEIFLNQCLTTFIAQPALYANPRNRITFTGSYLSGKANAWWGGYLTDLDSPHPRNEFLHSWEGFRDELVVRFGVTNPREYALVEIETFKQGTKQRVSDYITEFDALAKYLDWNDAALADKFFLGLAPRIKKAFSSRTTPRPTSLSQLDALAASMDDNYWLYDESGRSADKTDKPSTSNTTTSHHTTTTTTNSHSHKNKNKNGNSTARSNSTTTPASASKPDLTNVLNSAGKLNAAERQRRITENLCLYCGKKGHEAKDCNKAAHNREAKARAAAITPAATAAATPVAPVALAKAKN